MKKRLLAVLLVLVMFFVVSGCEAKKDLNIMFEEAIADYCKRYSSSINIGDSYTYRVTELVKVGDDEKKHADYVLTVYGTHRNIYTSAYDILVKIEEDKAVVVNAYKIC